MANYIYKLIIVKIYKVNKYNYKSNKIINTIIIILMDIKISITLLKLLFL